MHKGDHLGCVSDMLNTENMLGCNVNNSHPILTSFLLLYNLFTWKGANKAFYRGPKTTFLPYFHVLA